MKLTTHHFKTKKYKNRNRNITKKYKKQKGGTDMVTNPIIINISGLIVKKILSKIIIKNEDGIKNTFTESYKKHITFFGSEPELKIETLFTNKLSILIPRMNSFIRGISTKLPDEINYYFINTHGDNKKVLNTTIPPSIVICYFTPINHTIATSNEQFFYFKRIVEENKISIIEHIRNRRLLVTEDINNANNYGCFENSLWYYPGQEVNNSNLIFSRNDYVKGNHNFRYFYNFNVNSGTKQLQTFEIEKHNYNETSCIETINKGKRIEFSLNEYLENVEATNNEMNMKYSIVFLKACNRIENDKNFEEEMRKECIYFNFNKVVEKVIQTELIRPMEFLDIECTIRRCLKHLVKKENLYQPVDYNRYSRKIPILQKILENIKKKTLLEKDINYLAKLSPNKLFKFLVKVKSEPGTLYDKLIEQFSKINSLENKFEGLRDLLVESFEKRHLNIGVLINEFSNSQLISKMGMNIFSNLLNFERNIIFDNKPTSGQQQSDMEKLSNLINIKGLIFRNSSMTLDKIQQIIRSQLISLNTLEILRTEKDKTLNEIISNLTYPNVKLLIVNIPILNSIKFFPKLKNLQLQNIQESTLNLGINIEELHCKHSRISTLNINSEVKTVRIINMKNLQNLNITSSRLEMLCVTDISSGIYFNIRNKDRLKTLKFNLNVAINKFKFIINLFPNLENLIILNTVLTFEIIIKIVALKKLTKLTLFNIDIRDFDITDFFILDLKKFKEINLGNINIGQDLDLLYESNFNLPSKLNFSYEYIIDYPDLEAYCLEKNIIL